jgi:hypothetical protein
MMLVGARNRRGQTLIIAIMVMFILAVLATVFIALVARNLSQSARMSSTDAVAAIAEAGIRYADEMLTTSEDGADWRPIPDGLGSLDLTTSPPTPDTGTNLDGSTLNWQYLQKNDPDFQWIRAYWPTELGYCGPTGGYTRFNSGQGRFLLRVSYNPDPDVPMSKYIKLECVGRWGTIDPTDPTTLHDAGSLRLRREITAYKPMGLTDSCRFITNKDNRSVDVALGVPGYSVDFGRSDTAKYGIRGGPIRVNANLLWYGLYDNQPSVNIYLRGIQANSSTDAITGSPTDLVPIDDVLVSGDIKADADPANDANRVNVRVHELIKGAAGSYTDNPINVMASADPKFTTATGFYRDGQDIADLQKRPRGVKRIEPPLVDQPDSTNTTTRYRVLTLNSGNRVRNSSGRWVNLGQLGWGKGVYINNTTDKQDESETLFGGVTTRADLMQPGNLMTNNWKGPYYVPPAVVINLVPDDKEIVHGQNQYYFTITRDDATNGQKAVWSDASGELRPDWGATVRMPYPDPVNGRYLSATDHIDGNGVIYAEGNIRIRGMLPPGMKLTIVSNQNIYIDGSVLKYRDPKWKNDYTDNYRGADPTGGIALLARQNVIVNTTQFFTPLGNIGADDYGSDSLVGGNSSHVVVRGNPESAMRCGFEFGPYESAKTGTPPSNWYLFIRHSGEFGPAYINAWLNPADTTPNWGILNLNKGIYLGLPPHVWGVGDPRYGFGMMPPGAGVGSAFACNVFDLANVDATVFTTPGTPNILQIALDSNVYARSNYWMGGLAVAPMDVRIEAILYAQEGSLFVVPGYWLNPNPGDTDPNNRPPGVDPRFPLYGQSPDIRIIIDGAVSENLPASISDVEEWMAKWGQIPDLYGSSSLRTAHPKEGITFLYDDHVGWPIDDAKKPVRTDAYGRALPLTPKMPVSGSLIYFGDVM